MQGWDRSVNSLWLFLYNTLHMQSLLPDRSDKCSYLCYLEEEKGWEESIVKRELPKAVTLAKKLLAMNFFSYLCYKSRAQLLNWLFKYLKLKIHTLVKERDDRWECEKSVKEMRKGRLTTHHYKTAVNRHSHWIGLVETQNTRNLVTGDTTGQFGLCIL